MPAGPRQPGPVKISPAWGQRGEVGQEGMDGNETSQHSLFIRFYYFNHGITLYILKYK